MKYPYKVLLLATIKDKGDRESVDLFKSGQTRVEEIDEEELCGKCECMIMHEQGCMCED